MMWVGPYRIGDLLDNCLDYDGQEWPPESNAVYVVSAQPWRCTPSPGCEPLYVGGNTGRGGRFRTRIGDLLADLFGFFGATTGHHSGGIRLHNDYCRPNGVRPADLYLGWLTDPPCAACAERELYERLAPPFNAHRPPRCSLHSSG